jgi:hypothetical protein
MAGDGTVVDAELALDVRLVLAVQLLAVEGLLVLAVDLDVWTRWPARRRRRGPGSDAGRPLMRWASREIAVEVAAVAKSPPCSPSTSLALTLAAGDGSALAVRVDAGSPATSLRSRRACPRPALAPGSTRKK